MIENNVINKFILAFDGGVLGGIDEKKIELFARRRLWLYTEPRSPTVPKVRRGQFRFGLFKIVRILYTIETGRANNVATVFEFRTVPEQQMVRRTHALAAVAVAYPRGLY